MYVKVFSRNDRNTSAVANNSKNYLSNHFSEVRAASQAARAQGGVVSAAEARRKTLQKQKELEKLLMKAENQDISMFATLIFH